MMKARLGMMLTAIIVSICMLVFSFIGGGLAYGAEAPAGTADFDYNGYSASQLKAISECNAGIPGWYYELLISILSTIYPVL